ncbi:hypothetical protein [Spirosoma sp. 209]|uniref:hypothetical protein n=1 Tax=Spirosoma sp. 209 TaxID=1955701 RepID=UPI00098D290F|nr:hypothetical protein [Spirosoma sp. 209]
MPRLDLTLQGTHLRFCMLLVELLTGQVGLKLLAQPVFPFAQQFLLGQYLSAGFASLAVR